MKPAILGSGSVEELQGLAAGLFKYIPNKHLPQDRRYTEVPLRAEDLLTECFAKPLMDWEWVDLEFLGMLFALKAQRWGAVIYSCTFPVFPGGILLCRMHLIIGGLQHFQELVLKFFDYVDLVRKSPLEGIFDKLKRAGTWLSVTRRSRQ